MDLNNRRSQAHAYTVDTPIYEGPLDLLLQLIERAELDITHLSLAQVTDQYLEHLRHIQYRRVEDVSAFLSVAARLIQIKSEALLPRPPVREEGEEDPGEALARQLKEYKRFKKVALYLGERETSGLRTYLRLAAPPKVDGKVDLTGVTVEDLARAARAIFAQQGFEEPLGTVVAPPRVTIREKIGLIASYLRRHGKVSFRSLLSTRPTRLDVVVTFLAMLELIKRRIVDVRQEQLFDDIEMEPVGDLNHTQDFELEFGE